EHKTDKERFQANHHMLVAMAKAIIRCHMLCKAKIGPAPNISCVYPASSSPLDNLAAADYDQFRNRLYLEPIIFGEYPEALCEYFRQRGYMPEITNEDREALKAAHPDFIAFNYYGAATVKFVSLEEGEKAKEAAKKEGANKEEFMIGMQTEPGMAVSVSNPLQDTTPYNMGIDPVGLRLTLRQLWERYRLPLLITENGCGMVDELTKDGKVHDDYRIDYLRKHIIACREAITDGVPLMGYSPWSAFDLISTHQGITKRYGFIYVNRDESDLKDLARIKKDSFFWYKLVIESNGEDLS
ncbi:MAG: glycoside hydrolase family 1 protein, partial [Lachnospiraceae bacterium]|nr:glycoside hydrolase family 1 protein [Lachnospiraceae bacterium]